MRCFALAFLILGATAQAQTIAIDAEIAEVAFGIESGDDVMTGTAPEALRPYFPADAEVIGSVKARYSDGFVAFARLDGAPEAAAKAFMERAFEGRVIEEPFERDAPEGGFITTPEPRRNLRLIPTADQKTIISVNFEERARGGTYVMVAERNLSRDEQRRRRGPDGFSRSLPLESSVPLLTPPPGASQQSRGGGGGMEDYRTEARLTSTLSLAEIVAHYGAQMEADGWDRIGERVSDAHATSAWIGEQDGRPLSALFQAVRGEDGEDRLTVSVSDGG